MTETGRNYLSGSLFLSGVRDGNAAEKYTIRSVIGEGGSSVCYEAIRTKDKNGIIHWSDFLMDSWFHVPERSANLMRCVRNIWTRIDC